MPISLTHDEFPVDRAIEGLDAAGFEIDRPVKVTRTVLDTFDGRLHEAGLRLELCDGSTRELVLIGGGTPPAHLDWKGAAPRIGEDLPPGPFGARVRAGIGERALLPVFELSSTVREARRRDRRGKPVVSVNVHEGLSSATAPEATMPAWVAEIVEVAGHADDAERTAARFEAIGPHEHDSGVVELAVSLAGRSLAGRSTSPTVPLSADDDALEAFRAVLRNLLATMLDNLPGTIADIDPEFLHDFRVAIRRTRSVVAEGKKVLPAEVRDRFATEFRELAGATSRSRDLDVYVLGWGDTVAKLDPDTRPATSPVLHALEGHQREAHIEMCRVLDSKATHDLLDSWQAWLDAPDVTNPDAGPIGPYIAGRIDKAQRTVIGHGRAISSDSEPERLHDLRKDAKKLRYLLECFGSLLPKKARSSFVSHLKSLQDNLGEHQDLEVQLDELRRLAHDLHAASKVDADALLAVGRLIDVLDRRRREVRDEFATRFADYDTKDNRKALHRLLATIEHP